MGERLLWCPGCRGPLTRSSEGYRCPGCSRDYPIVFGIPDFRLVPDPYISFEDEYAKVRVLADTACRSSFEDLVRSYWTITPAVPRAAAERYIRYALDGEERGAACLEAMDAHVGRTWTGEACLEIGCGTGGFLLAARDRFEALVGADIALRWLVIARKRLEKAKESVFLVCCSAESLPFPDRQFDGVVAVHSLEHTADQKAALSEAARTLKEGGFGFFSTPNRFSLGPEACVRVWGVGFLPRSLASRYVRLVTGTPYRHIRPVSLFELRRLLAGAGFTSWAISPPRFAACEERAVSAFLRALIRVYHALRERPLVGVMVRLFGPFLQVVARR